MKLSICVVGAGTMGSGIALAAAQKSFQVTLFDINPEMVSTAESHIQSILNSQLSKGKISQKEKDLTLSNLKFSNEFNDCIADLVIEAIIEKIEIKTELFNNLSCINKKNAILASNTSSLSITDIQKHIPNPERVVGMHFFNPANLMKLVEVIKGEYTSAAVADQVQDICRQMDKTPVLCTDSPGFIVNRVARPYYLEAMYLVEQNIAPVETIDELMESCGFKMGPFKLMDLIGIDINLAVSKSVYNAMQQERFKPSVLQEEKVAKGYLGRKTKKGFYDYNK